MNQIDFIAAAYVVRDWAEEFCGCEVQWNTPEEMWLGLRVVAHVGPKSIRPTVEALCDALYDSLLQSLYVHRLTQLERVYSTFWARRDGSDSRAEILSLLADPKQSAAHEALQPIVAGWLTYDQTAIANPLAGWRWATVYSDERRIPCPRW